ncbi:MAG: formyltransferase [Deltaproteobacteria bacterium]|nr:formyltransferase [Deltaproteobacteria bacterium]
MRIAVFAYHDVGYECLKVLLDLKENIVAVVTHEDDPEEAIWFRSVAELARAHRISVYTPQKPNAPEFVGLMHILSPDLILSFYYRRLLSKDLLEIPRLGGINLHGSLLPKYRGRAPVNWAIINGEAETGVTLHYMIEEADAGDIVAQRAVAIEERDTALDLYKKIIAASAELLRETFPLIKEGKAPRMPQDSRQATKFGGRRPEDGRILWDSPARAVYNLIRAVTHPYPGAFTYFGGRKLFVWQATVSGAWSKGSRQKATGHRADPGTVEAAEKGKGIWVRTGDGSLLLARTQLEGEEEAPADKLAARCGITAGTRLGE